MVREDAGGRLQRGLIPLEEDGKLDWRLLRRSIHGAIYMRFTDANRTSVKKMDKEFAPKNDGSKPFRLHFSWICLKCRETNLDDTALKCSHCGAKREY